MSTFQSPAQARGARNVSPSSSGDPTETPQTPKSRFSPDVRPTLSPQSTEATNVPPGLGGVSLEPRHRRWDGVNMTPSQVITSRVIFPPSPDDIDYTAQSVDAHGNKQSTPTVPSVSQPGDSAVAHAGTVLGRLRLSHGSVQYPLSFADLQSFPGRRTKLPPYWNQQANVSAAGVRHSHQELTNEPTTELSPYSGQQANASTTNELSYSTTKLPSNSSQQANVSMTSGLSYSTTKLPSNSNQQADVSMTNELPYSTTKLPSHSNQQANTLSSSSLANFISAHDPAALPLSQPYLLPTWQSAGFSGQYQDELPWFTSGTRENTNDVSANTDEATTLGAFARSWQMPSHQSLAVSAMIADPAVNQYTAQSQRRLSSLRDHPFRDLQARFGEQQNSNLLNGTPASPIVHHRQAFVPPVRNQGFLPMQAIRSGREFNVAPQTPATIGQFSVRYHGMHTECNASSEHLRPEQNASLWITNLPPDVTTHELLGQIRNIGRVWASFINGPDGTKHSTAAAKIVFFSPAAAQRLLQLSLVQGFKVRGYHAKVTQNRIKTPETHPRHGNDSRVLIVTGHKSFVNKTTLTAYFEQKFEFQLDEVNELLSGGGRAVVEFKFGSYRCQSQMGKMSLEMDKPAGFEKAEFGEDPCEVGETFSSMEVALQRIRGMGI